MLVGNIVRHFNGIFFILVFGLSFSSSAQELSPSPVESAANSTANLLASLDQRRVDEIPDEELRALKALLESQGEALDSDANQASVSGGRMGSTGSPSGGSNTSVGAEPKGARLIVFIPGFNMKLPIVGETGAASMRVLMHRMMNDRSFKGMYDAWKMVTYNQNASAEQIGGDIERQLFEFIKQYKVEGVTVDVVGHSLGTAAAMFGAANDGLLFADGSRVSDHVNLVVNLAGVNFGQGNGPVYQSQILRQLQPYVSKRGPDGHGMANNLWLHNWIVQHRQQINKWDICAGWSPQDQQVMNPHDSGCMGVSRHGFGYTQPARCFGVSVNVLIQAPVHLRWLTPGRTRRQRAAHEKMYAAMKSNCWGR